MAGDQHHRPDTGRYPKYLITLALVATLSYLVNQWFLVPQDSTPHFFEEYFNDILALPIYIPLSFYLAMRLRLVGVDFKLRAHHILGAILLFSLIYEGLVPIINKQATRDPLDTVAYAAGGVIVFLIHKYELYRQGY